MKTQGKVLSTLAAFGLCAVLGGSVLAQRSTAVNAKDMKFATKAAQGGMAEVELGKLATQQASSDAVKQFGQRMVDDHSKANDELKQVASSKGIMLPSGLDKKDQTLKDRLSKLHGTAFDSAYMKAMVADHKKDVAEFRKASQNLQDTDLRAFASKTLPTLEDHLKMATDIERPMIHAHKRRSSRR